MPALDAPEDAERDLFVNFRWMTTVDASYLSRRRRLARLTAAAVLCLRRRLAQFFTDYAPMPGELAVADVRGGLVRRDRGLVSAEELRTVLGDERTADLLRRLYDPRARR